MQFDLRHLLCAAAAIVLLNVAAHAQPITPTSDDQVIETLPTTNTNRRAQRQLRRELAANPRDTARAVQLASDYMRQARQSGDPRLAGRALTVLQTWSDPDTTPNEVLLLQATVKQYLHDFEAATRLLEHLLARDARQAQAWLTLATVRRVQGRYNNSDDACARIHALAPIYASACRAENDALRGEFESARLRFQRLLSDKALDAGTRNWLLTSVAELEERAGRAGDAESAYEAAIASESENYSLIAYADFLISRGRASEALTLLSKQPRSDAVLLRLAIAGARSPSPRARADAVEMRERIAQASLRPGVATHAREQSMFALGVERQSARALQLARENTRAQREPIDVLIFAQAAKAAGDVESLAEVRALKKELGLHDARLDALL